MVRVFYRGYPQLKQNAWLGGRLFVGGVCVIEDLEEGKKFADMFHLKYEVIEEEKKATKPKTKKVKAVD